MLYKLSRSFLVLFFKIFCRLEVKGQQNIPRNGGFILASNHSSFLDPMVLGVACFRSLDYVARETLFNHTIFGWFIRQVGAFPIRRNYQDIRAIREAIRRLKIGRAIAMFPEGSRRTDNSIKEPFGGIGLIAYKAGVPIVPVFIKGTDKALPRGSKIIRPTKIRVNFGEKIFIERRQAYNLVAKEIMQCIGCLQC